jgi:hypothetical protein
MDWQEEQARIDERRAQKRRKLDETRQNKFEHVLKTVKVDLGLEPGSPNRVDESELRDGLKNFTKDADTGLAAILAEAARLEALREAKKHGG